MEGVQTAFTYDIGIGDGDRHRPLSIIVRERGRIESESPLDHSLTYVMNPPTEVQRAAVEAVVSAGLFRKAAMPHAARLGTTSVADRLARQLFPDQDLRNASDLAQ